MQHLGILIDCLFFRLKLIRLCFGKCYMSIVEIKYVNVLTDNESSFYQHMKNKQEAYENPLEMSKNDDYTTKNLLDYLYYQTYYKFTDRDLSRQTNKSISQKTNFTEKLEKDYAVMYFIAEKY